LKAGVRVSGETAGDKKSSYVGIHSTGFRDFLLKGELARDSGDRRLTVVTKLPPSQKVVTFVCGVAT
jgi:hypothetical protein